MTKNIVLNKGKVYEKVFQEILEEEIERKVKEFN